MASSTNRVNSFIIIVGFLKIVFHFVLPRRIIFKRKCYLDVTSQAIGLPFERGMGSVRNTKTYLTVFAICTLSAHSEFRVMSHCL